MTLNGPGRQPLPPLPRQDYIGGNMIGLNSRTLVCLGALAVFVANAPAQKSYDLTQAQIEDIVQKFAAKEAAFAKAREAYTYRQTARIQELDDGGAITGRWETVSDIVFSTEGKRSERVVRSPVPTLRNITLTPEDLEDMRSVQPFVLTTAELPKYLIRYLGHQNVDEIGCYVLDRKSTRLNSSH